MFDMNQVMPDPVEKIREEHCIVMEDDPNYLIIDTYVVDPDPTYPWMQTEYGPSPKMVVEIDGTIYLRVDHARISKS